MNERPHDEEGRQALAQWETEETIRVRTKAAIIREATIKCAKTREPSEIEHHITAAVDEIENTHFLQLPILKLP